MLILTQNSNVDQGVGDLIQSIQLQSYYRKLTDEVTAMVKDTKEGLEDNIKTWLSFFNGS